MSQYQFLQTITDPRHMVQAIRLIGTREIPGSKSNPEILQLAADAGIRALYNNDDTPWCGVFVAGVLARAGRPVLNGWDNLRALQWQHWGNAVQEPMFGDILVFVRPGGGHVGFYVGEDLTAYHVLGGNQGNSVNVVRIAKSRLVAARRPAYNNQPASVRKIQLQNGGNLSTNEA